MSETNVPAIPSAGSETFTAAVKELLEVREGLRGDPLDQNVTLRQLQDAGVVSVETVAARGRGGRTTVTISPGNSGGSLAVPPAIENLSVQGAYTLILLTWDQPTYSNHSHVEIIRSSEDSFANVPVDSDGDYIPIGQSPGLLYSDACGTGKTYYYWVRAVSTSGVRGPLNSVHGTRGDSAADVQYLLSVLQGAITQDTLTQSLGTRINLIDGGGGVDKVTKDVDSRIAIATAEAIAHGFDENNGIFTRFKNNEYTDLSNDVGTLQTLVNSIVAVDPSDGILSLYERVQQVAAYVDANGTSSITSDIARLVAQLTGLGTNPDGSPRTVTSYVSQETTAMANSLDVDGKLTLKANASDVRVLAAFLDLPVGTTETIPAASRLAGRISALAKDEINVEVNGTGGTASTLASLSSRVADAALAASNANAAVTTLNNTSIPALQAQIDGKLETWYQTTDPSAAWTTPELRTSHGGDLWFVGAGGAGGSYTEFTLWRWSNTAWVRIYDAAAIAAATAAANALAAANGRATTFYGSSTPTANATGDIWINPSSTPPNEPRLWNGTSWVLVTDGVATQAAANIVTLDQTKIGYSSLVTSPTVPYDGDGSIVVGYTATSAPIMYVSNATQMAVWNAAKSAALQMQWNIGIPLASAVRQVSVNDGSGSTASIEQRMTAYVTTMGGLSAQWSVKLDVGGHVSGFGLSSTGPTATPTSIFAVRADRFAIVSPSDTTTYGPSTSPTASVVPFVVVTTPTTIDGVSFPVGTYIRSAFIADATITNAKIGSIAADKITAGNIDAARMTTNVLVAANASVGYLNAARIDTKGLTVKDSDGNVVLSSGAYNPTFSPYLQWEFVANSEGWAVGSGSIAQNTDYIRITSPSSGGPYNPGWIYINGLTSPSGAGFPGASYPLVRARVRRVSGSNWAGLCFFGVNGASGDTGAYQTVASPVGNSWVVLEWDMSAVTGWSGNLISRLRLDLGNVGDIWDVDWVAVGGVKVAPIVDSTNISTFIKAAAITNAYIGDRIESLSPAFVAGSTGWQINKTGNCEFNNVTVRGTVYASAGSFTGTVSAATISGSTITGGTISGTTITAGTLNTGTINVGPSGLVFKDASTGVEIRGTIVLGQYVGSPGVNSSPTASAVTPEPTVVYALTGLTVTSSDNTNVSVIRRARIGNITFAMSANAVADHFFSLCYRSYHTGVSLDNPWTILATMVEPKSGVGAVSLVATLNIDITPNMVIEWGVSPCQGTGASGGPLNGNTGLSEVSATLTASNF